MPLTYYNLNIMSIGGNEKMKTEQMTCTIDVDLNEKLKRLAEKQGRSKSNLVNLLLKLAMEKKIWKA